MVAALLVVVCPVIAALLVVVWPVIAALLVVVWPVRTNNAATTTLQGKTRGC